MPISRLITQINSEPLAQTVPSPESSVLVLFIPSIHRGASVKERTCCQCNSDYSLAETLEWHRSLKSSRLIFCSTTSPNLPARRIEKNGKGHLLPHRLPLRHQIYLWEYHLYKKNAQLLHLRSLPDQANTVEVKRTHVGPMQVLLINLSHIVVIFAEKDSLKEVI